MQRHRLVSGDRGGASECNRRRERRCEGQLNVVHAQMKNGGRSPRVSLREARYLNEYVTNV